MLQVHPAPTGDGRLSLSTATLALLQGCSLANSPTEPNVVTIEVWTGHGGQYSTLRTEEREREVKESLSFVSFRSFHCKTENFADVIYGSR